MHLEGQKSCYLQEKPPEPASYPQKWQPPNPGMIKINIDASFVSNLSVHPASEVDQGDGVFTSSTSPASDPTHPQLLNQPEELSPTLAQFQPLFQLERPTHTQPLNQKRGAVLYNSGPPPTLDLTRRASDHYNHASPASDPTRGLVFSSNDAHPASDPLRGAVACICRDSLGRLVDGFAKSVAVSSAEQAEAAALVETLRFYLHKVSPERN